MSDTTAWGWYSTFGEGFVDAAWRASMLVMAVYQTTIDTCLVTLIVYENLSDQKSRSLEHPGPLDRPLIDCQ